MIKLSLALMLALACPAHKHPYHKNCKQITILTTADAGEDTPGDDTGGEGGHIPPIPPPQHPTSNF